MSLISQSCPLQDPGNFGTLIRSAMAFRWVSNKLRSLIVCYFSVLPFILAYMSLSLFTCCFEPPTLPLCISVSPLSSFSSFKTLIYQSNSRIGNKNFYSVKYP